jgi:hypothetical protein
VFQDFGALKKYLEIHLRTIWLNWRSQIMRKNIFALGLILTATLGFASRVPANADEIVNTQVTNQSAAAVGNGNEIYQQSDQLSVQQLKNKGGGSSSALDNLQKVDQSAGAVGNRNLIDQRSNQINVQQQSNRRQRTYSY